MKRFLKNAFLFSVVVMGLGIGSQAYAAEEQVIDSTSTSSTQQILESSVETYDSTQQKENTTSEDSISSSSNLSSETETTASIQESQTTLWDIEKENKVQYDNSSKSDEDSIISTRENKTIKDLYNIGVSSGIINPEKFPFENWKQLENSFLWPSYLDIKKEGLLETDIGYQQWLIDNNFGLVIGDDSCFEIVRQERSTADNKRKFMNTIKKGDFVVVSDVREPWAPYVGHAAIATTDNWILDMPGYKDGTYTKEDNNRQLKKGDWFDKYKEAWTTIYRVRTTQKVRNDIADWADWRYWSSSHGLKKNRHVSYSLATTLKGDYGKAYCSKLVWQALYYGSGDVPLVIPRPTIFLVAPYFLPGEMNGSYYPNKYGPY